MHEKKIVSVVVPIYNERPMIEEVCRRIRAVFRELEGYTH